MLAGEVKRCLSELFLAGSQNVCGILYLPRAQFRNIISSPLFIQGKRHKTIKQSKAYLLNSECNVKDVTAREVDLNFK